MPSSSTCQRHDEVATHVRYGSKADIAAFPTHVRFTPKSGHRNSVGECPLCAKSGHSPIHSINSSAWSSSVPDHLVKLLTWPKIIFYHNRLAALCVHQLCHLMTCILRLR